VFLYSLSLVLVLNKLSYIYSHFICSTTFSITYIFPCDQHHLQPLHENSWIRDGWDHPIWWSQPPDRVTTKLVVNPVVATTKSDIRSDATIFEDSIDGTDYPKSRAIVLPRHEIKGVDSKMGRTFL
jgi:hypothetical protein